MAANSSSGEAGLLAACAGMVSTYVQSSNSDAALLGSLVPVCLAVTLLSTPKLRKQWAFRLLLVALVVLMITLLLKLQTFIQIHKLFDRQGVTLDTLLDDATWQGLSNSNYLTVLFVPWICDCALLCRLLAFHPAPITSLRKRIAILAFPLAAHIPRLPLIIAFCCLYVLEGPGTLRYQHIYLPIRVVEAGLQLLVNCYCSGFLLHKTHTYARAECAGQALDSQQANRLRLRLRYLTESILFTFVPASMAQLGYFITCIIELSPPYKDGSSTRLTLADSYLRLFISIFCLYFGLLAVWWSYIRSFRNNQHGEKRLISKHAEDVSLIEWALGPLEPEGTSNAATSPHASVEEYQPLRPEKSTEFPTERESQEGVLDISPKLMLQVHLVQDR